MPRKQKKSRNPLQPIPRAIPLRDIPRELQPLALRITKLEAALITTRNAVAMNFDHLIDLLIDMKKESLNIIQQAKILEKAKIEKKE